MKKILTILVVGLMFLPLALDAQNYSSLWKQVKAAQDKDLPQTEYELLLQIADKAEAENAKVSIRNVRRNILEKIKKLKDSGVPEDEVKSLEKEMQDITDKFIKKADEVTSSKEKEIMAI